MSASKTWWPLVVASILVTLVPINHSDAQKISPTYPTKVSMGAFAKEVKGPVFYETFTPLIYEYQVPVYKNLDITLRDWRSKCESDSYTPSYTCPVFFHYERFLERFEAEVVHRAWVDPITNRSTAPSPMKEMDSDDLCNKIQSHFKGALTQEFGFEEYIEKLKHCLPGIGTNVVIERQITDYVQDIKTLFKKMNDNYEGEFSNKFFGETNKKIGPAFYVNAVTSHQNGMLVAYLLEKERWMNAISTCQRKLVPRSLLRPQNVTKNLKDLNQRLSIGGQQTAVNVAEISAIYNLPLADCSFIERTGSFVVRILIPVISKEISPKLFKVFGVPFLLEDKICELLLDEESNHHFVYDETFNRLQFSDCTGADSLCQMKDFEGTVTDLCLRAVFARDHSASKKYCGESFQCSEFKGEEESKLMRLPIIRKIYSDAWVVFGKGSASDKMSIKCEGSTAELKVDLGQEMSGALEIRLPCHCHLVFNSEILHPTSPCSQEFAKAPEIYQILPPQFLTQEYLSNANGNFTLKSFDLKILNEVINNENNGQSPQIQEQSNSTTPPPTSSIDEKGKSSVEGPSLALLWAVVIFQLILIMSILVFGIYRYAKFKREMSYSKERLVYNVYSSPSDVNLPESASAARGGTGAYKVTTGPLPLPDYMNHV